jgi:Cu/Ag efflux pump CusA
MAIAIMGGLTVATLLTIFFVPALYAAWFKVRRQTVDDTQQVRGDVALASE